MLKYETIDIQINNRNKNYFNKLGYSAITENNNTSILNVKITDLSKNSRVEVDVICDICKKEYKLMYHKYLQNMSHYGFFTCKKCSNEKRKMTNIKRYGVDNYAKLEGYGNMVKEINKEKYGDENYNNQEKHIKTCLEKYGVESYMSTIEFKERSKISKKEKYGKEFFTNPHKMKKTKYEKHGDENYNNIEKYKKTSLMKYGVDNYTKTDEFKIKLCEYYDEKLKNKNLNVLSIDRKNNEIKILCNRGHEYITPIVLLYNRMKIKTETCLICNPMNSHTNSGYECQLQNFIKENYNGNISLNNRKLIYPYEIDVYLSDLKLAFEFNGLYWHCDKIVDENYHLNKTLLCEKIGVNLIHIYEDDWIYKNEIIKNCILNYIELKNNNCIILENIDQDLLKSYVKKNNLNEYDNYDVSLTCIEKEKIIGTILIKNEEILIHCGHSDIIEKLIKYYIDKYDPIKLSCCVDLSWNIKSFDNLGFKRKIIKPSMYFVKRNKRVNYEKKLNIIFDSGKIEYLYSK